MNKPKLTPRPHCETCGGDGKIDITVEEGEDFFYFEEMDCPECEVMNDIENEQIEKL